MSPPASFSIVSVSSDAAAVDVLDVEGGQRVGARRQVQRVVALLQIDVHAADIVEQRQRVVRCRSRRKIVAESMLSTLVTLTRVGAAGETDASLLPAPRSTAMPF